jgi:hypothetical protein
MIKSTSIQRHLATRRKGLGRGKYGSATSQEKMKMSGRAHPTPQRPPHACMLRHVRARVRGRSSSSFLAGFVIRGGAEQARVGVGVSQVRGSGEATGLSVAAATGVFVRNA